MPPTMLLVTSPMERKVSYAQIENFQSVGGKVLPLVDAGLVGPYGIAWDGPRSALYICDGALRKIFRVQLMAWRCTEQGTGNSGQCGGIEYQLKTVGNRYVVVENVISQWASVDTEGNLYFTNQETNSVDKLSLENINFIIRDIILPKDLAVTTEAEAEGEESAQESQNAISGDATTNTLVTTPQPPSIVRLYEKPVCPNVGTPAGVKADGARLYWTNQQGGFSAGSVAEGKTAPKIKLPATGDSLDSQPTFPSKKIINNTGSSYGITVTTSKILYTDSTHYVWATSRGTGETVALSNSLLKPRGIVWDGDNTAYVADQEGNFVVSLPVGLLKANAPISHTVDIHAPFGIALISATDPIWNPFRGLRSHAHRFASARATTMLIASVALAMTLGMPTTHL